MRKLTNTEKAEIVWALAGEWMEGHDDTSYEQFLRIVDGTIAVTEEDDCSMTSWCVRDKGLEGICRGCLHNRFPWSGDPACCEKVPDEINDLLIKLDQAKEKFAENVGK